MDAPKSDVDRGREKSSTDFQVLLTCSTAGTPLDDRVLWCTLFTSVDSIFRSQAQSERAHTEEEKSLAFLWVCPARRSNAFFLDSSLSMYGVAITMRQKVVPCSQCAVPCREFTFVLATVSTLRELLYMYFLS